MIRTRLSRSEMHLVALHELGHAKLHVLDADYFTRRAEELAATPPIFVLHDQAELEAELFCGFVIAGWNHVSDMAHAA